MQEIFEKIKERLEELGWVFSAYYPDGTEVNKQSRKSVAYDDVIEIVNQVAEEYAKTQLTEDNSTDNSTGSSSEIPNNSDGWILVSERLPEEKENPVTRDWYVYPVMVRFEEITDIRYYSFGRGHWHHGPGIMDKYVTHWMDIKPYQPKGEK